MNRRLATPLLVLLVCYPLSAQNAPDTNPMELFSRLVSPEFAEPVVCTPGVVTPAACGYLRIGERVVVDSVPGGDERIDGLPRFQRGEGRYLLPDRADGDLRALLDDPPTGAVGRQVTYLKASGSAGALIVEQPATFLMGVFGGARLAKGIAVLEPSYSRAVLELEDTRENFNTNRLQLKLGIDFSKRTSGFRPPVEAVVRGRRDSSESGESSEVLLGAQWTPVANWLSVVGNVGWKWESGVSRSGGPDLVGGGLELAAGAVDLGLELFDEDGEGKWGISAKHSLDRPSGGPASIVKFGYEEGGKITLVYIAIFP